MRFTILLLALFLSCSLAAQKAETALEQFSRQYPQEKAVLLLSKPEYLAGETIYFHAYVLNGYVPSAISTNLYTELYDRNRTLLDKAIVPLVKGSGTGSFVLPASLAEDVYYVRAYTHWMLNFGEALPCIRPVAVYNPYSSQSLRPKPVQWTARAFVESDILVDSTLANVAVRLYTTGTLPQGWSGQLLEKESNTVIAPVTVYNSEIGQVRFVPEAGKTYQVLVADAAGKTQELPLPPVASRGVVLQTVLFDDKLRYAISFTGIASGGKGYKLVAAHNNKPVFTASIASASRSVVGTFNTGDIPAGILHLTLFDPAETPVLERLVFMHQDSLGIVEPAVAMDSLSVAPKGYNKWLLLPDSLSTETYAIEVTDASITPPGDFVSSIYLAADLAAPVHNAAWYFSKAGGQQTAALDALLLTEKWGRFQWADLLQNRLPSLRLQPDAYLSYTGTAWKGKTPQALRSMNLLLRAADSSISFFQVKTDIGGNFLLPNLFFTDTAQLFYQPEKRKVLERDIELALEPLNRFFPYNGKWPDDSLALGARTKTDAVPAAIRRAEAQKATELLLKEKEKMEAVVVTTRARNPSQELDRKLSSSLFSSIDARIFDFVNENQASASGYRNVLEWLQGRVAGYQVVYQNGVAIPLIRNNRVQVYIDEMPDVDYNMIGSISVQDIAMIKIFRGSFVGGANGIAIYTRRGDLALSNAGPGLPSSRLAGYRAIPPLPSPDYAREAVRDVTDSRLVLYYLTVPQPDTAGKLPILFYNNDSARQFRLVVTGFAADGSPVYLNKLVR